MSSTIIERTQDILIDALEKASKQEIEKDQVNHITRLSTEIIKVGNLQVKYIAAAGTLGTNGTVFGNLAAPKKLK